MPCLYTDAGIQQVPPYIALASGLVFIVTGMLPLGKVLGELDFNVLLMIAGTMGLVALFIESKIPSLLADLGGGNLFLLYTVIGWASVVISAFIDNIPYVATMIPVIASLAPQLSEQLGVDAALVATPLYFGLLSDATLGGNCTPIGASANIAGIGILRKAGYEVKNKDFFRIGIPFTLAAIIPAFIYIWLVFEI